MVLLVEVLEELWGPIVDVTDRRGDGEVSPYLDAVLETSGLVSQDDEGVRVYLGRRGKGDLGAEEK